jgi:two-component system NtrC family response regulator
MGKVLVIDDDPEICDAIASAVTRMGHEIACSLTLADGLEKAGSGSFDIVLLDVRLPDGDGLEALPVIQKVSPKPEVVIMTGFGNPDGAELAIKNGAWDYLEKPVSLKAIRLVLNRALQYQEEQKRRKGPTSLDRRGIVGDSPALRERLDLLAQAADSDISVLITGETGTGKELFALAIHKNSQRVAKSFVVVDCTALPKTLVESVLFGHEKGAYTGADQASDGLIKQADGGTLFLDEVGELPLEIQKKFLRVLQERSFRPVGSKREQKSDFRLIAATNQDLEELLERGNFREDLLFRLRAMTIALPSLKERREDIKPLALHHISRLCERYRTDTKGFSPDFFEMLSSYDWPGNVRELNQSLESALASAGPNPMLFPKDLPDAIRAKIVRKTVGDIEANIEPPMPEDWALKETDPSGRLPKIQDVRATAIADAEQKYLKELLTRTSGNIQEACRISGLSRSRLYTLLKQHGIPPTYPMIKADEIMG